MSWEQDEELLKLVNFFKERSDPVSLVFLIDNPDAMKTAAAWPYVSKHVDELLFRNIGEFKPVHEMLLNEKSVNRDVWDRLWCLIIPDLSYLSKMTQITADRSSCLFLMLRNARLIFPDGTIHDQARRIIGNYIQSKVKK